jgi:arylsulfatase A-like enzyme
MISRRQFTAAACAAAPALLAQRKRRPNVVILITDDQGYGDLSIHGNPHLRTPHLDSIGRDGVRFTQFHANPVCSPTRASLMTGRYYYRTGVVDTYIGRSMMAPDEVTMAEVLRGSGYRTGLFGKWHLGDHYPMRPIDQGFDHAVNHFGGGIGQPSDPPGGESYFDPLLQLNGQPQRYRGYCTDVIFDEALRFIEENRSRPFFTYIATNAPHTPLEVAEALAEPHRRAGLNDTTARIYGMVENIDANTGKLLSLLKRLKLEEDTIVFYMTDNGPQQARFNAGLRGLKGTVYGGGIRVPGFLRWPGRVKPGTEVTQLAAHIDLLPTIAEACQATLPADRTIDGRSLMPLIDGMASWPDRTLFFQWHRGDAPEKWKQACARSQNWKLVNNTELYNLEADPAEAVDVAARHPEVVEKLAGEYDTWFRDVCSTRGFAPIRIPVGTEQENPVTLSQQDWRGPQASWGPNAVGHWEIDVARAGRYEMSFRLPSGPAGKLTASLGGHQQEVPVSAGVVEVVMPPVDLKPGPARLEPVLQYPGRTTGVRFATLRRT